MAGGGRWGGWMGRLGNPWRGAGEASASHAGSDAASVASVAGSVAGSVASERQDRPKLPKLKARLVKDETLPDRSVVLPSQTLIKTWKMENNGVLPWPKGTKLMFIKGDQNLLTEHFFEVPCAKPGEAVDVSAVITTPSLDRRNSDSNGRHTAVFRLRDDAGNPFGPRLWCDVMVAAIDVKPTSEEKAVPAAAAVVSVPAVAPGAPESAAAAPAAPVTPIVPLAAPAAPEDKAAPASAASASAGAAPAAAAEQYAVQLQVLAGMGFQNRDLNLYLLQHNNGNVQKVCEFLLNTLYG